MTSRIISFWGGRGFVSAEDIVLKVLEATGCRLKYPGL
jgi:hypothetical protein